MHPEYFEVPVSAFSDIVTAKSEGKKVVGVGTTVIRTLESLAYVWREILERSNSGESSASVFLERFGREVSDFWNFAASELDVSYRPIELFDINSTGVS